MKRRLLARLLVGLAVPAAAQYPNRPVTMLTGYPAGGLVDIVARMIADNMKPRFPPAWWWSDRPGAAGSVAVGELTRAAPDGYTFILTPRRRSSSRRRSTTSRTGRPTTTIRSSTWSPITR